MKSRHSRLDELQAAILLVKLSYLESWNERRRHIARRYTEGLSGTEIICPLEGVGRFHVYHLYVVRVKNRDPFRRRMAQQGIETFIHYPVAVHRQEAYSEYAPDEDLLPITNRLSSEIVSLPLYPELDDDEVATILSAVRESIGS